MLLVPKRLATARSPPKFTGDTVDYPTVVAYLHEEPAEGVLLCRLLLSSSQTHRNERKWEKLQVWKMDQLWRHPLVPSADEVCSFPVWRLTVF